jgi:phosphatidate cytidylyltransferase
MADSLKQRVVTALVLAPLAIIGVLYLSTPWLALGLGVVCLLGVLEWTRLIGLRGALAPAALVAAAAAAMAAIWFTREQQSLRWATWVGVAWWPLAALWLRNYAFCEAPLPRHHATKALAGLLVVVPAWAAAVALHGHADHGHGWLLFVVLLVWCADVCAYFAGRRYGRARLAPRISPGKTLAGVYGALLGSIACTVAGGAVLGVRGGALAALVALALVTVGVSIIGDLYESLIKRHSQVKDSGTLFPGHGGVFDRFDSLFAALPVFAAGKLLLLGA